MPSADRPATRLATRLAFLVAGFGIACWAPLVPFAKQRLAIDDGLTMIISTHQIRFADEVADRVAFLSGGSIIEEGPAHEMLTHPRHPLTARFLSVVEADKAPEQTA